MAADFGPGTHLVKIQKIIFSKIFETRIAKIGHFGFWASGGLWRPPGPILKSASLKLAFSEGRFCEIGIGDRSSVPMDWIWSH